MVRRFWRVARQRPRRDRLRGAGALALVVGFAALVASMPHAPVSWETLLAPYSSGTPILDDFRIAEMRRGAGNDVVFFVNRPTDTATVEVHVVERGVWTGVHESQSFGIGYETPRSPAAQREAITDILAHTIRSRDRGLPSPAAIPLRADGDPTVLPWWLEMLRGGRGVLLGTSLVLLTLVALLQSSAVAIAGVTLGLLAVAACVVGIPKVPYDLGVGAMPAATLLLVVALRGRSFPARADRLLALAVVVIALVLRCALGVWGPLHVNGYGPRFVAAAARDPADIAMYGPGFAEVFAPIAALAPANPDWAIFAANALFSALLAPVAFALCRLASMGPHAAGAAALLFALDPVGIYMGTTESYFPLIILLCAGAGVLVLIAVEEMELGRRGLAAAGFAAAALLLVQASRVHPTAWGIVATVPSIALAGASRRVSWCVFGLLASAAISAGLLIATSGSVLLDVYSSIRGGTLMRPLPPPSQWPLVWIAGAAAVYAIVAPQRWLAVPAALAAAALLMTRHSYDQSWIWQHVYDRLYLTLPLIALVAAIPTALLRHRWTAVPLALSIGCVWLELGLPIISARTTDQLEYRWTRQQLAPIAATCRVIYVVSAEKRVLVLPTYVGPPSRPAVAIDLRQPLTVEAALAPTPCLYYVRTSLCSSAEGRPLCAAIESRLALDPIARATFPALPSTTRLSYDRDAVETMIARVQRVE